MLDYNINVDNHGEDLDVELGQLIPFSVEEFRESEYGFVSPTSAWCMNNCADYDPDSCPLYNSISCLGSENWRSVHAVWDTVDFVPTLLQVCREMSMPGEDLQRLSMEVRGKTQEAAVDQIRKEVSWADLIDYARKNKKHSLSLRTRDEMIAIRAITGGVAPMVPTKSSMKDIVAAIYKLRRLDKKRPDDVFQNEPDAAYWLSAEFERAFECPWSSPLWDAAKKSYKGAFTPAFAVECPKSGVIRSARMRDREKGAEANGINTHLFHPWFATDLLFVIDWEACPAKTEKGVLESREVLALVVDLEKDSDYRLCVASLERQKNGPFINWVCLETLAHLGDDLMWHKG